MLPAADHADPFADLLPGVHLPRSREERMRLLVDRLWDALHTRGASWIGFYLQGDDPSTMILGPRRDKPACSPIGLHGACGRSFASGRSLVVRDVASLGAGYIACDPLDRSELVVPLCEQDGRRWGVLDADSYEPGCFSAADARALHGVLKAWGLTRDPPPQIDQL